MRTRSQGSQAVQVRIDRWWSAFFVAGVAFGLLLIGGVGLATPRYAALYGQDCNLCHHDPTGGGKRSAYAAQFLIPMEMSATIWSEEEQLARLDGQIGAGLSVGADVRTLWITSEDANEQNGFFQMQADLYALFELDPRFSLYLDQGQTQTREVFAMGYVLPANGHVKVGRFAPAYGWRFSDHTLYTRERLGFAPPGHSDVGIEAGVYPGSGALEVSVTNGARGSIQDDDHRPALTARGTLRRALGPAGLALGASYYYNKSSTRLDRMAGPFASFHLGRFTWVGEADWRRQDTIAPGRDELVMSHEFSVRLRRGIDLRATYDFHDPDYDQETGALGRYGVGFDGLLYPFLGLTAMVHVDAIDAGPETAGQDERTRASVLFHFLY